MEGTSVVWETSGKIPGMALGFVSAAGHSCLRCGDSRAITDS